MASTDEWMCYMEHKAFYGGLCLSFAEWLGRADSVCERCLGSGLMVRDPDIGTDQECFVCDGTGKVTDSPS